MIEFKCQDRLVVFMSAADHRGKLSSHPCRCGGCAKQWREWRNSGFVQQYPVVQPHLTYPPAPRVSHIHDGQSY